LFAPAFEKKSWLDIFTVEHAQLFTAQLYKGNQLGKSPLRAQKKAIRT
jgi:hypothetical protein